MATLKALLKSASRELQTAPLFPHKSARRSYTSNTPLQRTPKISIHDSGPAERLFHYLTNPLNSLTLDTVDDQLPIYALSQYPVSFQTLRSVVPLISAHAASSGNTAFAVVYPLQGTRLDRALLPYTIFPVLPLPNQGSHSLSPLSVAHIFLALRTNGLILPPGSPVPLFVSGCAIHDSPNFRLVAGRGENPVNAIRALVHAVNNNVLEELSCTDEDAQLFVLRKWAFSHPVNRASAKRAGMITNCERKFDPFAGDEYPVVDLLTKLSRPFPVSTASTRSKAMIRTTKPRERWHSLTFLTALSQGNRVCPLTTQSPVLCHQLSVKSCTYLLTCLNGRERGFHVCHWGKSANSLPVVVEIEILEEADGSRSVTGMRLVNEVGVRLGFKALARAPVGSIVCRRGCCGLVEGLGIFVYGVPGDQLAVADCSDWFVGFI